MLAFKIDKNKAIDLTFQLALLLFTFLISDFAKGDLFSWLKPAILVFLIITSSKASLMSKSPVAFIGVLSHFAGFALMRVGGNQSVFFLSTISFYLVFIVFSYLALGRSISLLPAHKKLKTKFTYSIVRHPIYSGYYYIASAILIGFPTLINTLAFALVVLGTLVRIRVEEKVLLSADSAYADYKIRVGRKIFSLALLIPLLIFIISLFFSPRSDISLKTKSSGVIVVKSKLPPLSLAPLEYDDFAAVFIGNHIYRRLYGTRVGTLLRNDDLNIIYTPNNKSKVFFNLPVVKDCEGAIVPKKTIIQEVVEILKKKNWILPDLEFCSLESSDLCFLTSKSKDIQRSLEAIYLRVGWSHKQKSHIGVGPYCMKVAKLDSDKLIAEALLTPHSDFKSFSLPTIKFTTIKSIENFDLDLYSSGNRELLLGKSRPVRTHTPVAYYVLSNGLKKGKAYFWELGEYKLAMKTYLLENELVFNEPNFTESFFPSQNDELLPDTEYVYNLPNRSFLVPEYINKCDDFVAGLNKKVKKEIFYCGDPSSLINDSIRLKNRKWYGFLTPVIPGTPIRNGTYEQYFSNYSKESWLRDTTYSRFTLIGTGDMFVDANVKSIASVLPNPLGLSDLFITDLISPL